MSYAPPTPPAMHAQPAYGYGQPTRTSAAAVTSLICGIVGCLAITPIIAIITGLVGIRATANPAVRGRGLAIAGIILGVLWLLSFAAAGAGGFAVWKNSEPPAAVARQFTNDLAAGNVAAALANSGGLTEAELTEIAATLKPWGTVTDITLPSRSAKKNAGSNTRWELLGTATFSAGGTKNVEYVVESKPAGGHQVIGVHFK